MRVDRADIRVSDRRDAESRAGRPPGSAITHLLVLAAADAEPTVRDEGPAWASLRLAGAPRPQEPVLARIRAHGDAALARLQENYPAWLWRWALESGAFSLARLPGGVSWWWYAPISEKSCLRSPLIRELYWLLLLREVLRAYPTITTVRWVGTEPAVARAAERVVRREGRGWEPRPAPGSRRSPRRCRPRHSLGRLALRRVAYTAYAVTRWTLLALSGAGSVADSDLAALDVLLYTRFPNVWDMGSDPGDRMFGELPQHLRARGHRCIYAATSYGSIRAVLRGRRRLVGAPIPVLDLEAQIGPARLLRAHATIALFLRYLGLRRRLRAVPVAFDGIEVGELLWRELDRSVMDPEIPRCVTIYEGMHVLARRLTTAPVVIASFEFQPSERAVAAAAHELLGSRVAALQAGMYTANQMGWNLYPPELAQAWQPGQRQHLADRLYAYGELAARVFAGGVGAERVELVGGVRYPFRAAPFRAARAEVDPREGGAWERAELPVLVALGSLESEGRALLEAALLAAQQLPELRLAIKFHPLLDLSGHLRRVSAGCSKRRFEIATEPVSELLRRVPVVICGGTSVAMEAIVYGAMPLVFRAPGEITVDPMLHVPDAVFHWTTLEELRDALAASVHRDDAFRRRVAEWPRAVSEHLFRLDGGALERVHVSLHRDLGLAGVPECRLVRDG